MMKDGTYHYQGTIHLPGQMPLLTAKGSRFFYENSGDQFFIKGLQYQDFSNDLNSSTIIVDPLEDGARCARDIPQFKALGINTLYIVHIRPLSSHTDCMNQLRDAGIYVILNLGGKLGTESRTFRWEYPLADRFKTIVAEFAPFPNVLGFRIVGSLPKFIPFTKAAVRDLKGYLKTENRREIPFGFDSFEGIPNDPQLYEQLSCGGKDVAVDFLFFSPDFEDCLNVSSLRDAMDRVKLTRSPLPLVLAGSACSMEPEVDRKLLLSAYSENYLATHSGISLFGYFDNDFAIKITRSGKYWSLFCFHPY
jgi:1,3-beta-glucanosyltransferase GAS1